MSCRLWGWLQRGLAEEVGTMTPSQPLQLETWLRSRH